MAESSIQICFLMGVVFGDFLQGSGHKKEYRINDSSGLIEVGNEIMICALSVPVHA